HLADQISIRELAGQTVAVDTYCWLHKGAYACAEKLGSGQDTDQYVHYCMRYLRLLLANRLKVVLVFDGRNLPAKADLLAEGRSAEAREAFERCIDVTPSMALALMRSARKEGADTIVAPYEADAQLTHLCNAGLVDAVISEDSDLLAFGCKRVIFKLDSQGNGLLMDRRQIARQLCIPASADDPNSAEATGSTGMTWAKFRWMCILSGCDYFSGVPGVGLATAAGIVKRTCLDLRGLANKLFLYAKKVQRLSKEQVEAVVRADLTFQYQVVFDPIQRRQCRLNTPPSAAESEAEAPSNLDFAGSILSDNALALQLAHGNVDFRTMEPVADFDPADIGTPNNNKNIPTTNSSKNSSSIIWAGDGSKLDRRIASEASIVGAGNSPYFSSMSGCSGSGSAISASLWRTDSTNSIGIGATSSSAAGVGSTERLCRLYSSLSSDSLLAAEVATVAETDEKENSETSARLDDEIPANQAWPADVVEIADLTPSDAPATSGSQQQLRQPEFRLFGEPAARSQPLLPVRPLAAASEQPKRRQSVLSRYFRSASSKSPSDSSPGLRRQLFSPASSQQSPSPSPSPRESDALEPARKKSRSVSSNNAPFKSPTLSNSKPAAFGADRSSLLDRFSASRPAQIGGSGDTAYIDEALEMEPNNHVLLSNRCAARLKLGEFGLALQDARKCRTLAPDWPKRFDACRGYMVGVAAYNAIIRQPALDLALARLSCCSFCASCRRVTAAETSGRTRSSSVRRGRPIISWLGGTPVVLCGVTRDAQLSQHVDRLAAVVPQPNRGPTELRDTSEKILGGTLAATLGTVLRELQSSSSASCTAPTRGLESAPDTPAPLRQAAAVCPSLPHLKHAFLMNGHLSARCRVDKHRKHFCGARPDPVALAWSTRSTEAAAAGPATSSIFSAFSRSSSGSDSSLRWIRSSWMPSTSRSLSIDSKLFPNLQSTARRRKLARKSATDSCRLF
uniref:Exonuclease 1 n=1 Tax=Macrostomum lignano TaxID=282301 RepID=A0A1I8IHB6_9PLAT